jgi:hypothetical protein
MSSVCISEYVISNAPINTKLNMPTTIHNFETFDNTQPNLISKKVLNDIDNLCSKPKIEHKNKVLVGISSFYDVYISPNMFPIIMLSIFCTYLLIKYILKKNKDMKRKYKKNKIINKELDVGDAISDDYDIDGLL